MWEKTKKAAMDLSRTNKNGEQVPLPIVKVNREECAKSEIKKIEEAFSTYLQTKDTLLLPKIITQFENNRVGNRRPHDYIRETYFSQETIQRMLSQIVDTIKSIEDKTLRCNNINTMGNLISVEIKNFKDCMHKEGQNPGFNCGQYLQIFKKMKQLENEGQNR